MIWHLSCLYIKLYSHVLHISNTCTYTCSMHFKKNAETNIKILFKNLYSTSQVAVKIFNTDKKKTSGNSWCTHAIFWTHNNSKLMMVSCIKYMYHEQYFVNVLMSLDHDYAMFWCTIFLHYILLYYPIIQKTSRFKQYSMTAIKQSKYFSFEESLLVCQSTPGNFALLKTWIQSAQMLMSKNNESVPNGKRCQTSQLYQMAKLVCSLSEHEQGRTGIEAYYFK